MKVFSKLKTKRNVMLALIISFLMSGGIAFGEEEKLSETEIKRIKEILKFIKFPEQVGNGEYQRGNIIIGSEIPINYTEAMNSIAIGNKSNIQTNGYGFASVAIGYKAHSENGSGGQEDAMILGKKNFLSSKDNANIPNNEWPDYPGGVAIGTKTFARTGSVNIGARTYDGMMGGEQIGINADDSNSYINTKVVNMTTIGANSYQKALMGTVVGTYNITTSNLEGFGFSSNKDKYYAQNFGSSIFGTLNSNRTKGDTDKTSGAGNSIVGLSNIIEQSNGSLVFGIGNKVSNSKDTMYDAIENIKKENTKRDVDDIVSNLIEKVSDKNKKNTGGSTYVIGTANETDYAKNISIMGLRNKVIGTIGKEVENNIINGHDNEITGSSNNIVYGSKYIIKKKAQDAGTQTEDPNGNILFGNNTENVEINVKNTVAIGNNIKPNLDNSVYLGQNATEAKDENTLWKKDNRDKLYNEYAGFDKIGGIVSVGGNGVTRIIQNVAPGLISPTSTDAINGSQLYNYVAKQYITVQDGKGNKTQVKLGDTLTLNGMTVSATVKKPESTTNSNNTAPVQPLNKKEPQNANKPQEHTAIFETDTFEYVLRKDGKEILLGKGPDSKLYPKDFLENNVYDFNDKKWKDKQGTEIKDVKSYSTGDSEVVLNTKYGKVIGNVSDGVKDNDVANMGQLKVVKSKVDKNTSSITEINNNIVNIRKDINKVEKKADLALGGVSNAVAMANLVQVNSYSRHRHNLSAAYGYYGGSHALAIGFSGVNEKRNFVYKLSGAVNNKGNLALGLGVGVMLGKEDNDYPVNSKKVSMLEKDNKELKEKVSKLERMVTELLKRK